MTTFMKRLAGASMLLTFAASGVWASTADGIKALEAQDYKTAKQEFTDAAANDDTEAMYYLGLMMQRGLGDRAQPLAATVWWERASYLGDVRSQLALARAYRLGVGVRLNPRQAFVWDMQAAKAGSAEGMRNVGDYYLEGNGQEEDHVEAAKWYLRAARLGDVSSYVRLAKLFSEGDGVRKDAAAAYVLYNAAAHPPKGVSPDRNAAAGARNVKKFMKADDLARAEKLTLAEIFESLKAIDKEPVRTK